jgi:hypothetical protein
LIANFEIVVHLLDKAICGKGHSDSLLAEKNRIAFSAEGTERTVVLCGAGQHFWRAVFRPESFLTAIPHI